MTAADLLKWRQREARLAEAEKLLADWMDGYTPKIDTRAFLQSADSATPWEDARE